MYSVSVGYVILCQPLSAKGASVADTAGRENDRSDVWKAIFVPPPAISHRRHSVFGLSVVHVSVVVY